MGFPEHRIRPVVSYVVGLLGAGSFALIFSLVAGCEETGSEVIDSLYQVPYQSQAEVLPDIVDTDTINVGPQRLPDDVLPITVSAQSFFTTRLLPKKVEATVFSTDGSRALAVAEMEPSGPIDPVLGQKYTANVGFTIERTVIGDLQLEITGTGADGSRSNAIRLPLAIIRLNQPPVLSNLQAPDTVALENIQQLLLLEIDARDPNGQNDIRSVYFNSTRPNGTPSSGNPFIMYDDGTNGDLQPNDTTYSLMIVLPPTTTLGTYRFEFQAVDRSDSLSVPLVHLITVKQ